MNQIQRTKHKPPSKMVEAQWPLAMMTLKLLAFMLAITTHVDGFDLSSTPKCSLGNDTYELGERWNPNLPPFGVQVCVQCECILWPRKSCYEVKVTCRRITNECPIIDSCPDGTKPITQAGQCCKSCHSFAPSTQTTTRDHYIISAAAAPPAVSVNSTANATTDGHQQHAAHTIAIGTTMYKSDRVREYMSVSKSVPMCEPRLDEQQQQQLNRQPLGAIGPPSNSPSANSKLPMSRGSSSSRAYDLNGIDSRFAFKSLQQANSNSAGRASSHRGDSAPAVTSSSSSSGSSTPAANPPIASDDDHQHPNDIQSATSSSATPATSSQFSLSSTTSSTLSLRYGGGLHPPTVLQSSGAPAASPTSVQSSSVAQQRSSMCSLGGEWFHIGEKWSPSLPPFGVQVCVRCNCIIRQHKTCYEPRVTCKRISDECPPVDVCPDGSSPVSVAGQCCKTCPNNSASHTASSEVVMVSNSSSSDNSASFSTSTRNSGASSTNNWHRRNANLQSRTDKIRREYQLIMRTFPVCSTLSNADSSAGVDTSSGTNSNNYEGKAYTSSTARNSRRRVRARALSRTNTIQSRNKTL